MRNWAFPLMYKRIYRRRLCARQLLNVCRWNPCEYRVWDTHLCSGKSNGTCAVCFLIQLTFAFSNLQQSPTIFKFRSFAVYRIHVFRMTGCIRLRANSFPPAIRIVLGLFLLYEESLLHLHQLTFAFKSNVSNMFASSWLNTEQNWKWIWLLRFSHFMTFHILLVSHKLNCTSERPLVPREMKQRCQLNTTQFVARTNFLFVLSFCRQKLLQTHSDECSKQIEKVTFSYTFSIIQTRCSSQYTTTLNCLYTLDPWFFTDFKAFWVFCW